MISVIPTKTLIEGLYYHSTSVNLDAVSKQLYQKQTLSRIFFWSFANFLRIGIKNNSCWIAQNILSKEVKQVLQRRGGGTGVAM